jgi:hypothetical protein
MRALHLDVNLPVLERHAIRFREANIVLVASTAEVAQPPDRSAWMDCALPARGDALWGPMRFPNGRF